MVFGNIMRIGYCQWNQVGWEQVAVLTVANGEARLDAAKGLSPEFAEQLAPQRVRCRGGFCTPEEPEKYVEGLLDRFSGSYFWAMRLPDETMELADPPAGRSRRSKVKITRKDGHAQHYWIRPKEVQAQKKKAQSRGQNS